MVRDYKRKTTGSFTAEDMRLAVLKVIEDGYSLRQAALQHKVNFHTLSRYISKYKADPNCRLTPNYSWRVVFTSEEEDDLMNYLDRLVPNFNFCVSLSKMYNFYDVLGVLK